MTKRRTKKYQGKKPVSQHGGLIAIARVYAAREDAVPLCDDQVTDVGVSNWSSLENLRTGDADEESWSCVVCALNIGLVLCEMKIANEDYEELFVAALDGAFRAKILSWRTGGNFRLDGDAMRDIEAALSAHDAQMLFFTRAEVTQAISEMHGRMARGNVYQAAA